MAATRAALREGEPAPKRLQSLQLGIERRRQKLEKFDATLEGLEGQLALALQAVHDQFRKKKAELEREEESLAEQRVAVAGGLHELREVQGGLLDDSPKQITQSDLSSLLKVMSARKGGCGAVPSPDRGCLGVGSTTATAATTTAAPTSFEQTRRSQSRVTVKRSNRHYYCWATLARSLGPALQRRVHSDMQAGQLVFRETSSLGGQARQLPARWRGMKRLTHRSGQNNGEPFRKSQCNQDARASFLVTAT
eukprot:1127072-Amphidinium_carterae.4